MEITQIEFNTRVETCIVTRHCKNSKVLFIDNITSNHHRMEFQLKSVRGFTPRISVYLDCNSNSRSCHLSELEWKYELNYRSTLVQVRHG